MIASKASDFMCMKVVSVVAAKGELGSPPGGLPSMHTRVVQVCLIGPV